MSDFDIKATLKLGEKKLAPTLGAFSIEQLRALEAAERGEGGTARGGVLRVLQAEIAARVGNALVTRALSGAAVEAIAKACHEHNAAFCRSIGDDSQPTWEAAPEWQRNSAVAGVMLHVCDADASPSASHDSWMAQKLAEGWKHGDVKDVEAKTHPCIVPFEQLPPEQQFKDVLFKQTVHALAPLYAEIEALIAPAPPVAIGAGSVAEEKAGSTRPSTLMQHVAALAFCPEGEEVNAYFVCEVTADDFEVSETFRKAKYLHAVPLGPDMQAMAVKQVVALDDAGRPLARTEWAVPLVGGAGRRALFEAGQIAFDL